MGCRLSAVTLRTLYIVQGARRWMRENVSDVLKEKKKESEEKTSTL